MVLQIGYYALSALGILKKRSKPLTFMMLGIMWVVFGLTTYNGDFGNYSWIYQNIRNPAYWSEYEPLFNVFMFACRTLGLSFIQFRMAYGGVYLLLLYHTIGKYTKNRAEVLGLYMVFPFLFFSSVIRSGLANVLIVLAYYEVMAGRNNRTRFWMLMVSAVLFHYTSVFFVVYYYLRSKAFRRNSVILVATLVIVGFVAYYTNAIYTLVSMVTSRERLLKWFKPDTTAQEPRWVFYLIVIDLTIVFLAYLSKRENDRRSAISWMANPYAQDVYYLNVSMLIMIPTFFVSNSSGRLIWEMLLFNMICYAKDNELRPLRPSSLHLRISPKMVALILVLLFLVYFTNMPYRGTPNDGSLVFRNNLIYGEYQPSGY